MYIESESEKKQKAAEIEQITGQLEIQIEDEQKKQIEEFLESIPDYIKEMPNGAGKIQAIMDYKNVIKDSY